METANEIATKVTHRLGWSRLSRSIAYRLGWSRLSRSIAYRLGWSRLSNSPLFRCVVGGLKRHPWQTLRDIWVLNLYVRKTHQIFSLRTNGEVFLRDFIEACREAGMNPFLMWGTLLGCVREGGFLKHDHDIDVGILARDWPKRNLLIEAMRRRGYGLDEDACGNYKIRFVGRDLLGYLDVDAFFPWEGKMVCFFDHKQGKHGAWFPLDALSNFRGVTFNGIHASIPDPPERVLETIYGDWRTPVKEHDWSRIPNRLHIADGATAPKLRPYWEMLIR